MKRDRVLARDFRRGSRALVYVVNVKRVTEEVDRAFDRERACARRVEAGSAQRERVAPAG